MYEIDCGYKVINMGTVVCVLRRVVGIFLLSWIAGELAWMFLVLYYIMSSKLIVKFFLTFVYKNK